LDKTCDRLNKSWPEVQVRVEASIAAFEQAVATAMSVFGKDNVARKWTESGFEQRLNRAVLDVIVFYFSDESIRKAAKRKSKPVLKAFQDLCIESEEFRTSIETTTKSLAATSTRFILWGEKLRATLRQDFSVPRLEKRRIAFSGFWN